MRLILEGARPNNRRLRCTECGWKGTALELVTIPPLGICPCCRSWSGLKDLK